MKGSHIYGMTYYPAEGQMMFNVKADENGMAFVKQLRKALNRDRYTIRVRGSLSNRSGLRASGKHYDQSTPLAVSDRWRVYIDERNPRPTYQSDTDGVLQARIVNLKTELANLSVAEQQARNKVTELEEVISNWHEYYDETQEDIRSLNERNDKLSSIIHERNAEIQRLTKRIDALSYGGLSAEDVALVKQWEEHKYINAARYMYRHTGGKLMTIKVFKDISGVGLREAKTICDYLVFPFENPQRNG